MSSPNDSSEGAGDIEPLGDVHELHENARSGRTEREEAPRPPPDRGELVQYLAADGTPLHDVERPVIDDDVLLELYEALVFARRFDRRAVSLQRQGRLATWAPIAGQEGSQVASTIAMRETDYLYPTYRDNAAKIVHGSDPAAVLARQRGHAPPSRLDDSDRVFPESIPIASHLPHAVGAGMATDYRDDDVVHVAHFGDGATSEGDFHEAMNFAGVFDTPTVFICHNNGWAISHPTHRQTASNTLAEKASAYGFDGIRVDGMDPLAVYDVTRRALETARGDDPSTPRPTLIETVEYRLGAHSTADDPSVYRDGVPDEWLARDPVPRYETFLRETGRLDDESVAAVAERVDDRVADAVDRAEAVESPIDELFDHTTAEPSPAIERQRAELRRIRERRGDDAFTGDR